VLGVGLLLLSGCMGLSRGAPMPQHYVLGDGAAVGAGAPGGPLEGVVIGLRRMAIAPYLDTPLLVVRHGPNRITFSEFHRWSETPAAGVNRALAVRLSRRGPLNVGVAPWPARKYHDYLVQLHLLNFEGTASEDPSPSRGEAHLRATWDILRASDGEVLLRGTTDHREAGWTVGDHTALVALLDRALDVLADELIAGLEGLVVAAGR